MENQEKPIQKAKRIFRIPFTNIFLGRFNHESGQDILKPVKVAQTASNEEIKAQTVALLKPKVVKKGSKSRGAGNRGDEMMSDAAQMQSRGILPQEENGGKRLSKDEKQRLANSSLTPDGLGGKVVSGRKSQETLNGFNGFDFMGHYSKRKSYAKYGMQGDFDLSNFEGMDFDYLAEILSDMSPEISKALWDFLLLCNSGYECKAYKPNTKNIDKKAQKYLDEMIATVGRYHGTFNVFQDRIFKMIFLRGSFLLELILDENGYDFVDVATPDTRTLQFKRRLDPKRGQVWDFGQIQNGKFVSLDLTTVSYIPVHPSPDSIEGHSLCSAAFFAAIFLMAVLRDIKRVVQHQGYLRLDIEVQFDKLRDTMPTDILGNPQKVLEWMQDIVDQVVEEYAELDPDDTYVHSDTVKINNPVGTVSADSMEAIDGLFKGIERMLVRALKSMPILMGLDQSRSETQANREWEIYAKGIETVQHLVERGFEYIFGLALRVKGFQVEVKHRFAQFRAAEKMRDIQVAMLTDKVARFLYDCGIISQDEMAQMSSVQKQNADQPEPRDNVEPLDDATNKNINENPNPGESRDVYSSYYKIIDTLREVIKTNPAFMDSDEGQKFWRETAPEIAKIAYQKAIEELEQLTKQDLPQGK